MLLVLPPSRGQTPGPDDGGTVDLEDLRDVELNPARSRILTALAGTEFDATDTPVAPAARVFSGVLFAAVDLPNLLRRRTTAAERARNQVLIASPLLGMVRPTDLIPASKLALGTVTGIGSLAGFWRSHLTPVLDPLVDNTLVVDLRSSEFIPMWRPPAGANWVSVRVQQEFDGERRTVSHFAKHWRGILAHHLLTRRGAEPTDARSLQRATTSLVRTGKVRSVELTQDNSRPAVLTLVVD